MFSVLYLNARAIAVSATMTFLSPLPSSPLPPLHLFSLCNGFKFDFVSLGSGKAGYCRGSSRTRFPVAPQNVRGRGRGRGRLFQLIFNAAPASR